jgi:GNAT superfamily N-acetyltransferase
VKTIQINHKKGVRPYIQLTVRRVEPSVWSIFKNYHYLTAELNKSCKCLLFEWDGVPVAFVGILNTPRKGIPYGCSVSRIVILPDYQGLGLSTMIFNFIGGIVKSLSDDEHDYRLYIKTAHSKFGEALGRNPNVKGTAFDGKGRDKKAIEHDKHRYRNRLQRVSYCKEYIGEPINGFEKILLPINDLRKMKMTTHN